MLLYHTGFQEIRTPDVRHGRKNADFGQGFYLTADREFACRWARERKGMETVVNVYELDPEGLKILHLSRNPQWFDYIYANRSSQADTIDADVITGPIANDTLYDTFGIITSGFLKNEDALRLLLIGPEYHQTALKTEKAASRLKWLSAQVLTPEEIAGYRLTVAEEERNYQEQFAAEMTRISG
jgi:hypothetical protein